MSSLGPYPILKGVLALVIGAWALPRIIRQIRQAWTQRHDRAPVTRVQRVRLIAWALFPVFLLVAVIDALAGGPRWLFVGAISCIFVGWAVYLVLSFVWGALGGPGS